MSSYGDEGFADTGNGSLVGGAIHKSLLQQMAQSAYPGKTRKQIGPFTLIFSTPTLKFYLHENLVVVAIRGTELSDSTDLAADIAAFAGRLRDSARYKKDRETLLFIQKRLPPPEYRYIGAGHSLGGAILDLFLRDRLIQNGISYNPLVEPQEMGGNPLHNRIYHKDDPLYKWFGHKIPGVEVRTTAEPIWKYYLKSYLPGPLGDMFQYYDRHKIRIFKGGSIQSTFKRQLEKMGVDEEDYLAHARRAAERNGYKGNTIEFSDDATHKLQIQTPEGKVRRFGRVGYNDFALWSHLERNKEVVSGTAAAKRDRFWKSHTKIRGNWKSDDYSPNMLALKVLW